MGKDSGTKCSHCGKNGHNSRTCDKTVKTVKLFGVKISQNKREDPIKKSFSMGNLQAVLSDAVDAEGGRHHHDFDRGYLSDTPAAPHTKETHERKKGVPWTVEEHRTFLEGLKKLGKGDWRGISRSFVTTRTPTQVASHAQKYFLRQAASNKKKRRSSLFDMPIQEICEESGIHPLQGNETNNLPQQKGSLVQVANPVASCAMQGPPTIPMAKAQNVPYFNGFGYMVRAPGGQIGYVKPEGFPAVSVVPVPVVNAHSVGYVYQLKQPNNFPAYPSVVSQAYITPFSPLAAPQCAPKTEPHGSSTVNTDLKLSIAQPSVSDCAKIPAHASNMNGAIGVI